MQPDLRCYHHPDREAISQCDRCGDYLCGECMVERRGQHLCTDCWNELDPRSQAGRKLKRLSLATYIIGGLAALMALAPLAMVVMGVLIAVGFQTDDVEEVLSADEERARIIGGVAIAVGGFLIFLVAEGFAACLILSAHYMARHKRRTFCFVMQVLNFVFFPITFFFGGIAFCVPCIIAPFGIALGIFGVIILSDRLVQELFEQNKASPPSARPQTAPSQDNL